jgi:uroporphyrinogen-III synthase
MAHVDLPAAGDRDTRTSVPPNSESMPRILVTREEPEPLSAAVRMAHGEPVELPLLTTRRLAFELPRRLEDYDWIAFTSPRALEALGAKSRAAGWSWPPQVRAAAVGDRTAHELQAGGWMPECVSEDASARGLVESLQQRSRAGTRILFPCSAIAEPTFPEGMRAVGAMVDVVHVYTTEPIWTEHPEEKSRLGQRFAEEMQRGCVITCASPSAARAMVELARDAGVLRRLQRAVLVAMGPTTTRAAESLGLQVVDAGAKNLAALARKAVEISLRGLVKE